MSSRMLKQRDKSDNDYYKCWRESSDNTKQFTKEIKVKSI
jgi:hypothetical protein